MDNQTKDLKLKTIRRSYRKRGKKKLPKESQKMQEKRKQKLLKKTGCKYCM